MNIHCEINEVQELVPTGSVLCIFDSGRTCYIAAYITKVSPLSLNFILLVKCLLCPCLNIVKKVKCERDFALVENLLNCAAWKGQRQKPFGLSMWEELREEKCFNVNTQVKLKIVLSPFKSKINDRYNQCEISLNYLSSYRPATQYHILKTPAWVLLLNVTGSNQSKTLPSLEIFKPEVTLKKDYYDTNSWKMSPFFLGRGRWGMLDFENLGFS